MTYVKLHGPPMSVDKTDFGLVSINTLTFIGLMKHLVIGRLNEYQFFSAVLVNQRHTSCFTVYNRTVTNIENTAGRA